MRMVKAYGGTCLTRVSSSVAGGLEQFFYRYGRSVATHPRKYILACVLVTAFCCLGFTNFYMESRPEKLWIPQDSDYVKTLNWQAENFPDDKRVELILFEAENVLRAEYIMEMYEIRKAVWAIAVTDRYNRNLTQDDLCFRVPALGGQYEKELRNIKTQLFPHRDPNSPFDWSLELDKKVYYTFYQLIPTQCLEMSILEIWGDNKTIIEQLTDEDVINDINTASMSATYGYPMDFLGVLGGIMRNETGHVVGARSSMAQLVMELNRTDVDMTQLANDAGLAEEVDLGLYTWEGEFIRVICNYTGQSEGLGVFLKAQRSFGEISGETIMGDVSFLTVGIMILFVYVQLMLGKFNVVENRPVLSMLGLLATVMAVGISFGLCSAFGLAYGPIHSILPLLMLGLGVDDMFVIIQCWNNLNQEEQQLNLEKRMGCALRHAGVAITITSLTDFAVFIIGSTTVLPALQSFCIYSAIGIMALFLLQSTFFVAWFTIDQTRLEDNRNGLLWCYKHKNWTPNDCSQHDLCQMFFDKIFSKYLLMKPMKVVVLLMTAGLLATSIWGVTNLHQEFNPVWFIPQSSYLFQFLFRAQKYYPEAGERGMVYLGALNYSQELPKIGELTETMKRNKYISSVDSWYDLMVNYTKLDTGEEIDGKPMNETFFSKALSTFLFSPMGSPFQNYFSFDGKLTMAKPAPTVVASRFDYRHTTLNGRDEQIAAMDQMKEMVNAANFSDFAAPVAMMYSSWETDKVIAMELLRNLSLAMIAVFTMTLLLLANFISSIYVLICVIFTLVDVMALMTWWELSIDSVSCINLVLCTGLCVDYSVHIALHYMQVKGTRDYRVRLTVRGMGPAVINGAFSTFLAFILLANSDSHVFQSFFKIFFGVFVFGVFHGLLFLPVLLSLIGPAPYDTDNHAIPEHDDNGNDSNDSAVHSKSIEIDGRTYTQMPHTTL
ncbi:NPC intracellular cholesterol transporter 1 homolog 1b-like [Panulirus ornatus]|uniref:NPC intracellular cholesterol transporter 1 homolog 1b-like n=1 Tax=Panulirus ornatus TaxID=150431 RepID=UPI003A882020